MNEWVWNIGGMTQIGANQSCGRKTVPVNQKSYMDRLGIEPRPLQWEWHQYLLWSLEQCYFSMPAVDHTGVWRTESSSWQPDQNMYTAHSDGVYVCLLITASSHLLQLESLWAFRADGKLESLEMAVRKLWWLRKFRLVDFGTRWERERELWLRNPNCHVLPTTPGFKLSLVVCVPVLCRVVWNRQHCYTFENPTICYLIWGCSLVSEIWKSARSHRCDVPLNKHMHTHCWKEYCPL
jgi:hypothetical protein